VYWRQQKYEEAAKSFQKQLEVNPLDDYTHGNLGSMYCEQNKYAEAVPELETAISLKPDNPNLRVSLGQAYLNLNQPDKAVAAFDKAVEMAPNPTIWNNVAYQMAEKGANLDRAQQYAESAVAAIAASLRNVNLDHVRVQEAALVSGLGAYWDTLGWVHFKKGDLENAEKYIQASWQLMQHGEVGDHLAQVFDKRGKKEDAIHMYALAMAAYRPVPETRGRLTALLGDDKRVDAEVAKVKPELDGLRSVNVPAIGKGAAQADFLVLLSGPKADQVKFVRGDDKLQALAEALRGARFNMQFPDETPTKILRRGTVSCTAGRNECTFTMIPPDTVSSVN
jgi:tetratricopeptide (TPR) repeat protein